MALPPRLQHVRIQMKLRSPASLDSEVNILVSGRSAQSDVQLERIPCAYVISVTGVTTGR